MIIIENHLGKIDISHEYLYELIGNTVTSCFGVVEMNPVGAKQGFLSFMKKSMGLEKGISVRMVKNKLIIDLHITVMFGTNITAVVDSIAHKVRYSIEEATGFTTSKINVFVDGMVNI